MHPILARPARLAAYVAVAGVFGLLLGVLVDVVAPSPASGFAGAVALAVPLAIVYGFACLTVWYPVRALPGGRGGAPQMVLLVVLSSLLAAAAWVALGFGWARFLVATTEMSDIIERYRAAVPWFSALGLFVFALATLGHLTLEAVARSRAAARRARELQVLAREAELRSLKAQLDPHFLFNSLNSVSALVGSDPVAARRMCLLLAGFFRKSLGLGARAWISLAEELFLAETYLAIEQVRFGERLRVSSEIAEECLTLAVPPLVLQPLVENAVHHGIAHCIAGGEVRIRARRLDGHLEVVVDNPCDPERPASKGAGVGLANVRGRLAALFDGAARLEVECAEETYRARLVLPARASTDAT